jgi:hypothetical protein
MFHLTRPEIFLTNFLELRQGEVRRMHRPKLSEKGYEQHSERGLGRYKDGEMGRKCLLGGT